MGVTKYKVKGMDYYRADFYVKAPDGRTKRVAKKMIPNREIAEAFVRKIQTEAFEGRYFDKPNERRLTVAEAWNNYKPVCEATNKDSQTPAAKAKWLVEHLGDKKAYSLTQRDVDDYREKRRAQPTWRKKAPMPATLNREIGLLRRILSYAVKRGDLRSNPLSGVEFLPEHNVRTVFIDETAFEKLYEAAEDLLKPILVLAYETGMRKSEILMLTWDKVNLKEGKNGVIRLNPQDTKTQKARVIYLTQRAKEALEGLATSTSGYVFVNPDENAPWNTITKKFDRARTDAKMPHVWFHDLRRAFVTYARKRGVPESVVMRMSGHRTREVFDRYNIVSEDDLKVAVDQFEKGKQDQRPEALAR